MRHHVSEYSAKIIWQKPETAAFVDNEFSRHHLWQFAGGLTVPASAAPHLASPALSVEHSIHPEEAYVASLSSCHMLWFLAIAAGRNYVVQSYIDEARGVMAANADGKLAMTRVTLRPQVCFSADAMPTPDMLARMHRLAHENCFIANSVKTEVLVKPVHAQT